MATRRHTDVLRDVLPLAGMRTLDIGCGRGGLARWLQRQGALVLGVDAQETAVAAAGVPAVVAAAEALPLPASCMDAALIFNSLHHFEAPEAALAEALRVLVPGGRLYVAEPLAEGPYFTFMQPVDDESEVRARALAAIERASGWDPIERIDYVHEVVVADLESEFAGWLAVDPGRAPRIAAARDELARRLARHGVVTGGGHALAQPMRAFVMHAACASRR